METKELTKISDAEWEVMRVVWSKKSVTSQEVIDVLSDKMDWKPATIKTLLGRLVKKELVSTETAGKKFRYAPLVNEQQTVKSVTENLFSRICAKKIGRTISELIEEAELTTADLDLIKMALKEKALTAVDSVACNCVPGQCDCHEH